MLQPYADHNVLVARRPLGTLGSASHYLGLLAATMGRWDDAVVHLQTAIAAHDRLRAPTFLERSRLEHARAVRSKSGKPTDDTAQ